MSKDEQMYQAILDYLDPKFHIVKKEKSIIGKIHSRVFDKNAAFLFGHTCYVAEIDRDDPSRLVQLLAHEGCHIAQRKDWGVFWFNWLYLFPQGAGVLLAVLGLLGFVGFLAIYGFSLYILAPLGLIILSIPLFVKKNLASHRFLFELQAYVTSWWALGFQEPGDSPRYWPLWLAKVQEFLSRGIYLQCGANREILQIELLAKMFMWPTDHEKTQLKQWHSLVKKFFLA